jgi:hypothetical protein
MYRRVTFYSDDMGRLSELNPYELQKFGMSVYS